MKGSVGSVNTVEQLQDYLTMGIPVFNRRHKLELKASLIESHESREGRCIFKDEIRIIFGIKVGRHDILCVGTDKYCEVLETTIELRSCVVDENVESWQIDSICSIS